LKSSGFNEEAFPDIAAEALARVELEGDFEFDQIADFLITTKIPQQPSLEFSNLPPVVYRCEEFYIELLIWMEATTEIHQHGFSGAFRVLVGSSFHGVYEFEENHRINSRLLLGEVRLRSAEILRRGDVRRIHPGRSGLAHALFHLERPSVTMVVRSYGEPWNQPQYSFNPPNVAYDVPVLKRDSKVRLLSRLLNVASALNREQAVELLVSKGTCLDFPRLFMVVKENHSYLSQESDWERFMEAAREVHGHLSEHLAQMVKSEKRRTSLISARNGVTDPNLRFFLALLLNLPSRAWIHRFVQESFPGTSPEILCCQWLGRLRDEESLSRAFIELAKKANVGRDRFQARLKAAVPFEPADARREAIFRAAITGVRPQDVGARLDEILVNGKDLSDALDAYGRLRQLDELEPFFAN
jgi:hypothetical protein